MYFISYELSKWRYFDTQARYEEIIGEKETLFNRTQPKAATYDKEKVTGGKIENAFDTYLIAKDRKQIDKRLAEIKSLLEDRFRLLCLREKDVRNSTDIKDRVYCLRYLEGMRIGKIARITHYSESQVKRYLYRIKKAIEKEKDKDKDKEDTK